MKKLLIGILIGLVLSSFFFLIKDFFTIEVRVPKNHVTVRLLIEAEKEINSIKIESDNSTQTIELKGHKEILMIFPNYGEDEFKICCQFKDGTESCTKGHYVESGYSPTLKITNSKIETLTFH